MRGPLVLAEIREAVLLAEQPVVVGRVGRGRMTDGHAAGLVIAGDDDQGFLRMLLVELQRHADGVVEVEHVADGGHGVVGVAGPVDLAALDHEEEASVPSPAVL